MSYRWPLTKLIAALWIGLITVSSDWERALAVAGLEALLKALTERAQLSMRYAEQQFENRRKRARGEL
jgi:hypothetical protein